MITTTDELFARIFKLEAGLADANAEIEKILREASVSNFNDKPHYLFLRIAKALEGRGEDGAAMMEMYERIGPLLKAGAGNARLRDALEGAKTAWESLPEDHYSCATVQTWLTDEMSPAINVVRRALDKLDAGNE